MQILAAMGKALLFISVQVSVMAAIALGVLWIGRRVRKGRSA